MQPQQTESLGMFSQMPRELQIETWLNLTWKDRETICLSDDPPFFCFSEDVWRKLLNIEERISDESLDSIVRIWTPIINKIFKETSIPGPKKYYLLRCFDSISDYEQFVIKASDPKEALLKASNDQYFKDRNHGLYKCAISYYMDEIEDPDEKFSFKTVANVVLEFILDKEFDYKLSEVRLMK